MTRLVFVFSFVLGLTSFAQDSVKVSRIAFGSCGHETHKLSIFDNIVEHNPDVFIFLGDNIYGDTKNMKVLQKKYNKLAAKPTFQNLKSNTRILATWDDHDYGQNDAGRHYSKKNESKEIFLDFFEEPDSSSRRKHKGIYHSEYLTYGDKIVQVILLDVRTFRDDLKPYNGEVKDDSRYFYKLDYSPYETADSTLLGEQQWQWLENELRKDADVRLICSGSQFSIEYNGYESWANFPFEQVRMLNLINSTKANGVVFLTGDVHYAEISKIEVPQIYPIYDVTASGLSSTWHFATPNANRIEGPVMENHFGMISIRWEADPKISMEIWDIDDNQRIEYSVRLGEISFE